MGSHSTLNRMPHQRIRETGASVQTPTAPTPPMEEVGYETNLEDLNLFARYACSLCGGAGVRQREEREGSNAAHTNTPAWPSDSPPSS